MLRMVIINTSPIQYLHQLGLISILNSLYGKVHLPEEVSEEIEQGKLEGINLPDINSLEFVNILPKQGSAFNRLVRDLDKGETAVILNSLVNPGSLVVIDDFLARKVSMELNLNLTGTAGILIAAKLKGLIDSVGPYLDRLNQLGFYLAPVHRLHILRKAEEDIQ